MFCHASFNNCHIFCIVHAYSNFVTTEIQEEKKLQFQQRQAESKTILFQINHINYSKKVKFFTADKTNSRNITNINNKHYYYATLIMFVINRMK